MAGLSSWGGSGGGGVEGAYLADASEPLTGTPYHQAEADDGNSGASKTLDWGANAHRKLTVTDDCELTFTAPSGPANLTLKLVNGGSQTITWPASVLWAGGTEPTLTASGTDIVCFYFDGTNYHGAAAVTDSQ